nr:protein trichome birefringence-like 36 [Ipomoea trifida]
MASKMADNNYSKNPLLVSLYLFSFVLLCNSFCAAAEPTPPYEAEEEISMVQSRQAALKKCDFTAGKWVFDESYPLYDSRRCPYLTTAVTCAKNGRPDSDYEKWRWKPNGCTIPRFDALDFLGRMRKKRIMLVGDSITRNQWESLVCLVQSVIPTAKKSVTYNGTTMNFHALDYETSIEFCWAPFLVELRQGVEDKKILHLDLIEENAKYWRGVDVLVFDSAHWWTHSQKWTSWDYIMEGSNFYRYMNPMVAYEKGLMTWAKWIDLNLDPGETRVFFRSMSPRHNGQDGWKCFNQREPLEHLSHPHVAELVVILKQVLRKTSFPVYLQDITSMSALRRDAHPSIYNKVVGPSQNQHMREYGSDCSHWCLPGVPDIWNEMLNVLL